MVKRSAGQDLSIIRKIEQLILEWNVIFYRFLQVLTYILKSIAVWWIVKIAKMITRTRSIRSSMKCQYVYPFSQFLSNTISKTTAVRWNVWIAQMISRTRSVKFQKNQTAHLELLLLKCEFQNFCNFIKYCSSKMKSLNGKNYMQDKIYIPIKVARLLSHGH